MRRLAFISLVCLLGCQPDSEGPGTPKLSPEALQDPEACKSCHPVHYDEWSGSMHAYAAEDPLFLAMNARGQRETQGELGDFCVQCHAPMAVLTGATTDGLNLDELPRSQKGVTCYFCHQVDAVNGTHNNPLSLAFDNVMRGGLSDAAQSKAAHRTRYSPLHDRDRLESSDMCGTCHDIVTPLGAHIERTYTEWKETLYARDDPTQQLSCSSCHMQGRDGLVADVEGVSLRRVHSHTFAGVDVALTPFPNREAQRDEVQRQLDTTLVADICVFQDAGLTSIHVILENVAAGHSWTSGAAADRRAWVELEAFDGAGNIVFESGKVAEGQALVELDDPQLFRIGDKLLGESGEEVHMFWEAADYETALLPGPTALSPLDPGWRDTHVTHIYSVPGAVPERIAMRVKIRPFGLDIVDDLVASGDLDPAIRSEIPTFTLRATDIEWLAAKGKSCVQ